MIRKLTISLGAVAVVAAAALAPTAASAGGGWKGPKHFGWHGGHGGFGVGFYGPAYYAGADCYVVRRVVHTPYGKRLRRVTVCN
ncbi:MAG TPA: hypothetical protein VNR39_09605 [Pseudolabrys sp.]|nr:hypothetical protein [Pseudolabrys sp.]